MKEKLTMLAVSDIILDTSYSNGARFVMTLWHAIC